MTYGTSATSGANGAPLVVNGLVSGINTSAIISALLQSYQIPITNLQEQQAGLNSTASDYQALNSDMQSLLSAAGALNTPSLWDLASATSSAPTVATATSSPGAQTGSLSFDVTQLAQSNVLVSQNGVASTGTVVTTAASMLVATGGAALGFSTLGSSGSLALGAHTIDVTQSSSAATLTGATPLAASTTITTGSNDTVSLTANGTAYSLTLAAGTYTPSGLVAALNTAAASVGAPVTAALSSSGSLRLSTNEQGSAATLTATGGTGLSALGLSASQSATGTSAVVTVDGTSTTLTSITAGGSVTLAAPAGSITATIASSPGSSGSLVAAGSAKAALVSTGNGSLGDVVSGINSSGLSVTAEAVQQSSGSYLLQVGAGSTGLAGAVTLDTTALSSGPLGTLGTITAAQNAIVAVGGSTGYQVTSSSNTFTGLLAGTAITAVSTGLATVTVAPDAAGEATKVAGLVSAANKALADIQQYAGYNAATKTGGPLMGSAIVNSLQQQILSIFASTAGSSTLGNSMAAGITLSSTGTLNFNSTTFDQAYSANPSQVASLFTQGGTFAPSSSTYAGDVSFVYAGIHTQTGSYAVQVSHSATQASDAGNVLSTGTTSTAENLTIADGTLSATYSVAAGQSLTSIAAGLNSSFASAGMGLTAAVVGSGTQLQITTNNYGSAQSFQVTSTAAGAGTTGLGGATANVAVSFAGSDVVGTINGVAATGIGQVLAAPTSDPTLQGLSVLVSATGITTATTLGSFTYTPGLAQQLASLADGASNTVNGALTTTVQGLQSEATGLNSQISNYQKLEVSQQTLLQNEFAKMETTLGNLKSESSSISSSLAGLPGF